MNPVIDLGSLKTNLAKRTIRDQVCDRITSMVQSGLLQGGDELPSERELAATLEVSRETIRGAIQMLAARGMVEISQGSRTRVRDSAHFHRAPQSSLQAASPEGEKHVFEARRIVELPTIRIAVERIGEEDLLRLRRLVDAQREMTADPVRFQISDAEFHSAIYRAAGNPMLEEFLNRSYSFGLDYRRRVLLGDAAVELSVSDHEAILDGFLRRDADAAETAMARHLDRIHRTTIEVMSAAS